MRAVIQLAYRLRRAVHGALKIRTTGVKILLFNHAREVLLIRNSYGNSGQFLLPGGGVGRGEHPADAAVREVQEELGMIAEQVEHVWTYQSTGEGKRDTIHLFRAFAFGPIRIDGLEVVEARFFALDSLPENVSPATLRRLGEVNGERTYDGRW